MSSCRQLRWRHGTRHRTTTHGAVLSPYQVLSERGSPRFISCCLPCRKQQWSELCGLTAQQTCAETRPSCGGVVRILCIRSFALLFRGIFCSTFAKQHRIQVRIWVLLCRCCSLVRRGYQQMSPLRGHQSGDETCVELFMNLLQASSVIGQGGLPSSVQMLWVKLLSCCGSCPLVSCYTSEVCCT